MAWGLGPARMGRRLGLATRRLGRRLGSWLLELWLGLGRRMGLGLGSRLGDRGGGGAGRGRDCLAAGLLRGRARLLGEKAGVDGWRPLSGPATGQCLLLTVRLVSSAGRGRDKAVRH